MNIQESFKSFKKSEGRNIFAESVPQLCDAEKRRIHACSNGRTDAWNLAQLIPCPQPEKVFSFDNENQLEVFADGSLYDCSSGDSTVWAFAGDFAAELDGGPHEKGLLEFFGLES